MLSHRLKILKWLSEFDWLIDWLVNPWVLQSHQGPNSFHYSVCYFLLFDLSSQAEFPLGLRKGLEMRTTTRGIKRPSCFALESEKLIIQWSFSQPLIILLWRGSITNLCLNQSLDRGNKITMGVAQLPWITGMPDSGAKSGLFLMGDEENGSHWQLPHFLSSYDAEFFRFSGEMTWLAWAAVLVRTCGWHIAVVLWFSLEQWVVGSTPMVFKATHSPYCGPGIVLGQ